MINLNNTPSSGPLTPADLERWRAQHRPYMPEGCDQQGQRPQAAEACTDVGADEDDLAGASGILRAVMWSLMFWFVVACVWAALARAVRLIQLTP